MKRAPVIAATVFLAGCGAATVTSPNQRATGALRALAACVRTHGVPGFPDPVLRDDGVPVFPDSAPGVPPATQRACATVAARVPPEYMETRPVSATDLRRLLVFARCVRAHGIPDWPDPNALGEFPIGPRIERGGKHLFVPAARACARDNPDPSGGIHVVQAR
jgi:hypothetical protein